MGRVEKTADTQQTRERDLEQLYRQDPYSWARAQAEALRRRDPEAIDWEHVTDEIEDLAREAEGRLKRHYRTVIQHVLELQYGEGCDTGRVVEWETAGGNARMEIELLLQDCPGLKAERHRLFQEAWELGREKAILALAHEAAGPRAHRSGILRHPLNPRSRPGLDNHAPSPDHPQFHELSRPGGAFSPSSAPDYPPNASCANFSPFGRKKRPQDALYWTFSGSGDL